MLQLATRLFIFTIVFYGVTPILHASDLEKEQRWREQIVDALLDGEAADLNDGKHEFLAIHTEGDSSNNAGIIIMHGIGIHPDYPTVINPLRVGLAERGWHTLSIQLPVLPNEAEAKDYTPLVPEATSRVKAAKQYLQQLGLKKIAIVAHSMGTAMAAYAIDTGGVTVDAYVAIGMNKPAIAPLANIRVPVLDLYGQDDLPEVTANAALRKTTAEKNSHYTQVVTENADHFFNGQEEALVSVVDNWLQDNL
mgnify:FL=1